MLENIHVIPNNHSIYIKPSAVTVIDIKIMSETNFVPLWSEVEHPTNIFVLRIGLHREEILCFFNLESGEQTPNSEVTCCGIVQLLLLYMFNGDLEIMRSVRCFD